MVVDVDDVVVVEVDVVDVVVVVDVVGGVVVGVDVVDVVIGELVQMQSRSQFWKPAAMHSGESNLGGSHSSGSMIKVSPQTCGIVMVVAVNRVVVVTVVVVVV